MSEQYDSEFYGKHSTRTLYSAHTILELLLPTLPRVESATDLGCGDGAWLSVLHEKNCHVQGFDGSWVENLLKIPRESFQAANLDEPIEFDQRYDLAMSLEVAEHLYPKSAETFVDSLTRASDFVLFSAAIPMQDGVNHFNEQWQQYWADLFAAKGYVPLDFLRFQIWDDEKISIWYRQNMLLYVKEDAVSQVKIPEFKVPLSLVHPAMFAGKVGPTTTLGGCLRLLKRVVKRRLRGK